jgi:hypothetical protein
MGQCDFAGEEEVSIRRMGAIDRSHQGRPLVLM